MNPSPETPDSGAFDLRQLIRAVAQDHNLFDLKGISADVAEQVPSEHLRAALRAALPLLVRDVLTEGRPTGPIGGSYQPTATPGPTGPVPGSMSTNPQVPVPFSGSGTSTATGHVPSGHTGRHHPVTGGGGQAPRYSGNRKGAEIRDGWQASLKAVYAVAGGRHKQLGDCTAEDLAFMAAEADTQADHLKRRAIGWRRLKAVLEQERAATVRDLPANTLIQVLG